MAMIKLNFVGATSSLKVWLMFGKKCANCEMDITFEQMQIDHIIPQSFYLDKGLKVNHGIENLSCLCRSCNASKGSIKAQNFFTKEKYKWVVSRHKVELPKDFINTEGKLLAMSKRDGKFAKLFRSGIYYQNA
jgi:hypothetical protein